ncbi:MAG TPA: GNAT family N-acetyltransferase [Chthonomonadaceae bacterium]|nr:GNAT family N-acetyltransferase [Chthonomonadaceae bacterium]
MNATEEKSSSDADMEPDKHCRPRVSIRPYSEGDYPAMHAIWIEAELYPFTEIEVDRLLKSGGGALVAEAITPAGETLIVGTLLWSHNGQAAWLWKLAVAPHHRNRGIARRMLRQVEQDVVAAGLSGVGLLTRETNTAAQSLYTREGWKQSAVHQFWGKRLIGHSAEPNSRETKTQKEPSEC